MRSRKGKERKKRGGEENKKEKRGEKIEEEKGKERKQEREAVGVWVNLRSVGKFGWRSDGG